MSCDLHTHTNHSDGSSTPRELAAEAKRLGLIIALTDHNTVTGLPEFLDEADRFGFTAIGGTELSTVYGGKEFHLLGLFIEPKFYDEVERLCTEYHMLKEQSNIALVNRLCEAGYRLDYSVIKSRNVKGNVNRAHIAAELVEQGYVGSINEAFDRLLDEKCGFYIPPKRLELSDAIRFLRGIKALPVLAHPLKEVDADYLRSMLPDLIDAGLVGIETMHSSYSDEKITVSKEIAKEFGLLESGGSDYHGSIKPGVMLGVGKGNLNIDDCVYHAFKEYREKMI
ncbi:MAG: PHP domain-containing protein [Clostridia bacterium]|nr:PHP domain-containing protein [Clostridia bacterium]